MLSTRLNSKHSASKSVIHSPSTKPTRKLPLSNRRVDARGAEFTS